MKRKVLLFLIMFFMVVGTQKRRPVFADDYVTRAEFLEMIVKELKLQTDKTSYIDIVLKSGILTKTTFGEKVDYDVFLSKSDAAILLVRADEYLNGVTITNETIQYVIDKRISDIEKISDARKPFVAKAYALGYLVGASNGNYSTNRKFSPSSKITINTAKDLVARIKDKSKRATLSPDFQVIRTTKLPSNATMYSYILASFPNAYYDWEFQFMKILQGTPIYGTDKLINLIDYAAPVDVAKFLNGVYQYEVEEAMPIWEEQLRRHLEAIFNVDYRTIQNDRKWNQTVLETSEWYGTIAQANIEHRIKTYIDLMKKNKTIIECDKIAFDMSTLYVEHSAYHVRVYVHYRINSALKTGQGDAVDEWGRSALFCISETYPDLSNVKIGEWRNGYFDVKMSTNKNLGVSRVLISDYFYNVKVVK